MLNIKKSIAQLLCFSAISLCPIAYAGNLTIVIDDIGYRLHADNQILAMPKEIAVAIIPSSPHATAIAREAHQQGRDILIHLPMQPSNPNVKIEKGALFVGMDNQQVAQIVEDAYQKVPFAIGLNNHMGSAATKNKPLMQKLMENLKADKLSFLDSKTIGSSVAEKTAKEFGIRALSRNIFLDDSNTLADVRHQVQSAIRYAQKHGQAIAIGHPRKNTIIALKEMLSHLPKDVQLVSISKLWGATKDSSKNKALPYIYIFQDVPATTSAMPFQYNPLLRGVPQ